MVRNIIRKLSRLHPLPLALGEEGGRGVEEEEGEEGGREGGKRGRGRGGKGGRRGGGEEGEEEGGSLFLTNYYSFI